MHPHTPALLGCCAVCVGVCGLGCGTSRLDATARMPKGAACADDDDWAEQPSVNTKGVRCWCGLGFARALPRFDIALVWALPGLWLGFGRVSPGFGQGFGWPLLGFALGFAWAQRHVYSI